MGIQPRKFRGLEEREVIDQKKLLRDVRPLSERIFDNFRSRELVCILLGLAAVVGVVSPGYIFCCFFSGLIVYLIHKGLTNLSHLPFRMPIVAKAPDPNSPAPGRRELRQAGGIVFLGNEVRTNQELWLEMRDILTHTLLMGTTGAGKTEALVSISYNALATGSGVFYIDPKAAPQLAVQIWQMARFLGREDDFRVLNYGTAGKGDKIGRITNTNNPFSLGSAEALTQILTSLMPSSDGSNAVFSDKAINLISGVMYCLVDLRDKGQIQLSVSKIRDTLNAENCVKMISNPHLSEASKESLRNALFSCNWVESKELAKQEAFFEQYGYAQSYFGRALSSLTDTYGHIYGVEAGEVDFRDVVLNRRILVTMLPAMEKSPSELASLGKITLSAIRAATSVGLGLRIEGEEKDVLGALPVHFLGTGPFISIVDEYAAIVTPGFEILLTQGRGLGMATVVASQDYAGMVEAERKGSQQIVSNTNIKIFMKMQDPDKTWHLVKDLAGEAAVMQTTGYQIDRNMGSDYRDNFAAHIHSQPVIALQDLMRQTEGEAHYIYEGKVFRGNMFYAAPSLKGAVLRVPRMLQMPPIQQ